MFQIGFTRKTFVIVPKTDAGTDSLPCREESAHRAGGMHVIFGVKPHHQLTTNTFYTPLEVR